MIIERYHPRVDYLDHGRFTGMVEHIIGDWVRYEDYLERNKQRNQERR